MGGFCIEVSGPFACFTRPEMKVERVSYDVMTPSAARAIFEAILWKPAIRWQVEKIEVLSPIRWINLRRNEVGSKVSVRNVKTAMKKGKGNLGLYVEDDRQQRAGLFLRDVKYRIYADFEILNRSDGNTPVKFAEMFRRRATRGQCFNQPYLGCREFSARFRLVDPARESFQMPEDLKGERVLGWMLYDLDYSEPSNPMPRFFDARLVDGVLHAPDWNSDKVRG
ncbi:MAG: type I-C CRISPR-associated protein Cas5c [Pseudomonadota bacterium]